jgi:opacity protein-like surface antigen
MKKVIIVMLMIVLGSALFGLDISYGGGLILGGTFNKMETNPATIPAGAGGGNVAMTYSVTDFDFGAFIFADITYAELSIGFLQQIGKVTDIVAHAAPGGTPIPPQPQPDETYISSLLLIDLLGKYPFTLNEKISIYPALGIMFRVPVAGNANSDFKHNANWGLGIKVGAGLDFTLTEALFLRCELLCYYELAADKEINAPIPPAVGGGTLDFKVREAGYYLQPQVKIAAGLKL